MRSAGMFRFAMAVAALLPCAAAPAQHMPTAACEFSAWSTDDDLGGLGVRANPDPESALIARLPPPIVLHGDTFRSQVSITGTRDGWFRIDKAWLYNYATDEDSERDFDEAWVSGRFLGLSVESANLRSAPSHDAPLAADFSEMRDGDYGPDYFDVQRLHACTGYWVEVEGDYLGERFRGWTEDTCSSQVTTCP